MKKALIFTVFLIIVFLTVFFAGANGQRFCHSCYETRWRTQTATVTCDESEALVEAFQISGFTQTQMRVRYENGRQVCDILAVRFEQ